jgi:hypothetical protein
LLGDILYNLKSQEFVLKLCKPNREVIAILTEAYDLDFKEKLIPCSELSFKIPYFLEDRGGKIENEHFDLIKKIYFSRHYLGWKKTIWPIQWRTGGNIFIGYLLVFIYTPIYYQIFGPKEAGQIGLTMACLNTIFVLSLSPLVGKFPLITRLISEDRGVKASKLYQTELKRVVITYCLLAIALLALLMSVDESLASRFMGLGPTIGIVVGMFFYLNACALGYFMRAHLVDTSLRLNLISLFSMLAIGIAMSYWVGMWGVPLAMLIVFAGILYPGMKKIVREL